MQQKHPTLDTPANSCPSGKVLTKLDKSSVQVIQARKTWRNRGQQHLTWGQVEKILHIAKAKWGAKERKHVVRTFSLHLCTTSVINQWNPFLLQLHSTTTLWAGITPLPQTQYNQAKCQLHCGRVSPRYRKHNTTKLNANYIVGGYHPATANTIQPS